uniref:RWP-RK domain-containing protein n=1 Tax=Hyaloperonospora arabidopsidis (strain Emoy2) TaxID=559515 RepID=M4C4B5_HYAAE
MAPPVPIYRKRSIASIHSTEKKKKLRKSRRVYDFTFDFLAQFFHMPQRQAADVLNVSVITIKRNCKRHGFRWPYRANKYKSGHSFVFSEKGRAFHELPLDCLREDPQSELPTKSILKEEPQSELLIKTAPQDELSSECDTDTESIHDDDQAKNDYGEILVSLHKLPMDIDTQ